MHKSLRILILTLIFGFAYLVCSSDIKSFDHVDSSWIISVANQDAVPSSSLLKINEIRSGSGRDNKTSLDGDLSTSWSFKRSDVQRGKVWIDLNVSQLSSLSHLIHFFPDKNQNGVPPEWMDISVQLDNNIVTYRIKGTTLEIIDLPSNPVKTIKIKVNKVSAKGRKLVYFGNLIFVTEKKGPIVPNSNGCSITSLTTMGDKLYAEQKKNLATQLWALSTILSPKASLAHLKYGYGLMELGLYDGAKRQLQLARNLDPNNPVIILNQADNEIRDGEYHDASILLREARKHDIERSLVRITKDFSSKNRIHGTHFFGLISVGTTGRERFLSFSILIITLLIPSALLWTHRSFYQSPTTVKFISYSVPLLGFALFITTLSYISLSKSPSPFPDSVGFGHFAATMMCWGFICYAYNKWLSRHKGTIENKICKEQDNCTSLGKDIKNLKCLRDYLIQLDQVNKLPENGKYKVWGYDGLRKHKIANQKLIAKIIASLPKDINVLKKLFESLKGKSASRNLQEQILSCIKEARYVATQYVQWGDLEKADAIYHKYNLIADSVAMWASTGSIERALKIDDTSVLHEAAELCKEAKYFEPAGILFEKSDDLKEADFCFEKANAFEHQANISVKAEDWEKAYTLFKKADKPDDAIKAALKAGMSSEAAEILTELERFEEAERVYLDSNMLAHAVFMWIRTGKPEKGYGIGDRESFLKAARLCEEKSLLEEAATLYRKGSDLKNAERCFQEADQIENAAEIAAQKGDFQKAFSLFNMAGNLEKALDAAINGDMLPDAGALNEKLGKFHDAGEIYLKLGKYKKAADLFEKTNDYTGAGLAYDAAGEYDKAYYTLKKCGNPDQFITFCKKRKKCFHCGTKVLDIADYCFRCGKQPYSRAELEVKSPIPATTPPVPSRSISRSVNHQNSVNTKVPDSNGVTRETVVIKHGSSGCLTCLVILIIIIIGLPVLVFALKIGFLIAIFKMITHALGL